MRAWPIAEEGAELVTGLLECEEGHLYPVVRAIPRLLPHALAEAAPGLPPTGLPESVRRRMTEQAAQRDAGFDRQFTHTRRSFSSEWAMMRADDRAWGLDVTARLQMFLTCFGLTAPDLAGKTVLDAGCGHGEVEAALLGRGAEVFAMDLSSTVDDVRRRLGSLAAGGSSLHIVQGNVHAPPFKDRAFDLVHSAGVLHHTPDTRAGFRAVSRCLRPGGACYIEVYSAERKSKVAHALVSAARRVTVRVPHPVLHAACTAFAPLLWAFTHAYNAAAGREVYRRRTLREARLSLFDGFSPRYAHHHGTDEVMGWFAELGFARIRKTFDHKNGFGITGVLIPTA
jgi:SAM-dependent methyltransferase